MYYKYIYYNIYIYMCIYVYIYMCMYIYICIYIWAIRCTLFVHDKAPPGTLLESAALLCLREPCWDPAALAMLKCAELPTPMIPGSVQAYMLHSQNLQTDVLLHINAASTVTEYPRCAQLRARPNQRARMYRGPPTGGTFKTAVPSCQTSISGV